MQQITCLLLALLIANVCCALPYVGVNQAGAEFGVNSDGTGSIPGSINKDYTYPTRSSVDYFLGKGFNTFRFAFRWERLQRSLNGPLDEGELGFMDSWITYTTGKGGIVLLDPHNYARYGTKVIGADSSLTSAHFADFWEKLAAHYKSNSRIIFGLMNEPKQMPTELWLDDANDAIAAIRKTGAKNLILVPGNGWTGAHSWMQNWYGKANGDVMKGINDPADNFAFEVHQYLDSDSSGTAESCVGPDIGTERLKVFTDWCRQNKFKGFLGEFGGGRNDVCNTAVDNMLSFMDSNDDVWIGWTWWAAGPWWGDYIYTLEPKDGKDRSQMSALSGHLHASTAASRHAGRRSRTFSYHP